MMYVNLRLRYTLVVRVFCSYSISKYNDIDFTADDDEVMCSFKSSGAR